jgi:hypothetical protein
MAGPADRPGRGRVSSRGRGRGQFGGQRAGRAATRWLHGSYVPGGPFRGIRDAPAGSSRAWRATRRSLRGGNHPGPPRPVGPGAATAPVRVARVLAGECTQREAAGAAGIRPGRLPAGLRAIVPRARTGARPFAAPGVDRRAGAHGGRTSRSAGNAPTPDRSRPTGCWGRARDDHEPPTSLDQHRRTQFAPCVRHPSVRVGRPGEGAGRRRRFRLAVRSPRPRTTP